jgi:hypothetical protein
MEYTLVNLVTFVLGLSFLFNDYRLVAEGREDIAVLLMSGAVGFGLIVVAIVPDIFNRVATVLGLELKARAILITANLALFVIATYLFNRISTLYTQVSQLNEELTLLRAEQNSQDDK